jgi:hypothetical protein
VKAVADEAAIRFVLAEIPRTRKGQIAKGKWETG